jgi:hypothetical protein
MWRRVFVASVCLMTMAPAVMVAGCNGDPGTPQSTALYRQPGQPDNPSSGERGSIMITEIGYAGSMENDGTYHEDDVFIEFHSNEERPINMSGWHIKVDGDVSETYRLPDVDPIYTNEYLVVSSKENGAYSDTGDEYVTLPDLDLGKKNVQITLRDADERLMGSAGSEELPVFTGGWDTQTVRSMERVQLLFINPGRASRSWHAYSDDEGYFSSEKGFGVADGYRQRTLASPGVANSTDYSGSVSSGDFN